MNNYKTLSTIDILAIGFMTFSFFLGAGNIIFPPLAGLLAGEQIVPAAFGFLLTAVGLPLLGILSVSIAGNNWQGVTCYLPPWVSTTMAVLIFIVIGPAFAEPRTGLVAYEMAIKPLLGEHSSLLIFSILFFSTSLYFSWASGKLIDYIGKILTPTLFITLIILGVSVFLYPQSPILAAQSIYINAPFTTGFLEGYNTMDTFAALMFGMLLIDIIKKKGISDKKLLSRYLVIAGIIAAVGLAFVYLSLFYLGATSSSLIHNVDNGGTILAIYVQALFGPVGQYILSIIVLLACLTTSIGLTSAFADYMSTISKISYRIWVILVSISCMLVANIGLAQLISLSIPVLYTLYPMTICLVFLTFIRKFIRAPKKTYRNILIITLLFSLLDAAKVIGITPKFCHLIPFFDDGLAWVLPALITLALSLLFYRKDVQQVAHPQH